MKNRILFILSVVLISLVLLELALRLAGFTYMYLEEHGHKQQLKNKDTYKIICFGDSTTANKFPRYLDEELNSRGLGIKFIVIDKAKIMADSNHILANMENNLDKYRPDMVITMMGLKSGDDDVVVHEYERQGNYFKKLKSYKLARLIYLRLKNKALEIRYTTEGPGEKIWEGIKAQLRNNKNKEGAATTLKKNEMNYVGKGHYYRDRKEYKEAEEMYGKAVEINPGYDQGYLGLGDCYKNTGRYREAEIMYKKAIEINPGTAWNHLILGDCYRDSKKYQEAEEMYNKTLAMNPLEERAYLGLADCYLEAKKYTDAEKMCKKVIEINPKNELGYLKLGDWYTEHKKYKEAENLYSKVLQINPKNVQGYTKLGNCYMEQKRYPDAEKQYRKLIELNPNNELGYIKLGDCYKEQKKYTQAQRVYAKAMETNPKNEMVYIKFGNLYREEGKLEEAEEQYRKAIEINPKNEIYVNLGNWYGLRGKLEQAEDLYRKALEINPKQEKAFYALSMIYEAENRFDEAGKMLKNGMKQENENDIGSDKRVSRTYDINDRDVEVKYENIKDNAGTSYLGPASVYNYKRLRNILKERRITYVCVQYPVREVADLEGIFGGDKGIIFVDNEKIFKDGVEKEGYNTYFTDKLGENFGHCTDKGNLLLARNITDTIIKSRFSGIPQGGRSK